MRNLLFEVTPLDPVTNLPVTLRMSFANADSSGVILDGYAWKPLIVGGPVRTITLFGEGQTRKIEISHGEINFLLDLNNIEWSKYDWDGALARVWVGELGGDFASYNQFFEGACGPIEFADGVAKVPLFGSDFILDETPLLTASYSGTGGAEGDAKIKGSLKPVAYGACSNIEPLLIDGAYRVYQVHGYGPINAVTYLYENAFALKPVKADFANYASLIAATLLEDEWATCLALGLFRMGGNPIGKLTADVEGAKDAGTYVSTIATIVPAILKVGGVSVGQIDQTSLDAFSGHSWSFYSAEQATVGDVAKEALYQAGGYLFQSSTGVFKAGNYFGLKAPITLNDSSAPLVRSVKQLPAYPPNYRVKIGADRCYSVHSAGEISPALAEIQDDLQAAQDAAIAAQATADQASANSTPALSRLDAIVSDGVLDRSEKAQVAREFQALTAEKAGINSTATGLGITVENTAYNNAYTALNSYLIGLTPAYDDVALDTTIVRATWNTNWNTLYSARQAVLNQIATVSATKANWTSVSGRPNNLSDLDAAAKVALDTATTNIANFSADGLLSTIEKKALARENIVLESRFNALIASGRSKGFPASTNNEMPTTDKLESWTLVNVTRTLDAATDPDGNMIATKLTLPAGAADNFINAAHNCAGTGPAFAAASIKVASSSITRILLHTSAGGESNRVYFEASTGKVLNRPSAVIAAGSYPEGNGYRRYWMRYWPAGANTNNLVVIRFNDATDAVTINTSSAFTGGTVLVCRAQGGDGLVIPPYTTATSANTAPTVGSITADAVVNAREAYYDALRKAVPAYDDETVDSTLIPADSLAGDPLNPAWVTTTGATIVRNGAFYTLTDDNAAAFEAAQIAATISPNSRVTAVVKFKKDATGKAVRYPILRISIPNAPVTVSDVGIDTSTGVTATPNGVPLEYGSVDVGDSWLVWVTALSGTTSTGATIQVFPAVGVNLGGYSVTSTGSVDVKEPQLFVGTMADRARASLKERAQAYSASLENLATAIRAIEVQTQWSVDGSTAWHSGFVIGDKWMRQSTDNGVTWGTAAKVVAEGAGSWTPVLSSGMLRDGSTFTKTGASAAWDQGFYSLEKAAQMAVSFKASQTDKTFMIGLNSDPTTNDNFTSIDYALQCTPAGGIDIWANGSYQITAGTYTTSDVLGVAHRDDKIVILKNGVVLYTFTALPVTSATLLSVDSSFNAIGATANSVSVTIGGQAGNYVQTVFKRSATQPATPTGNGPIPSTWADAPPADDGATFLWMSKATLTSANVLVGAWATPIRVGNEGSGSLKLVQHGVGECFISGGVAYKVGGVHGTWDTGVYSQQSYTGGAVATFSIQSSLPPGTGSWRGSAGLNSDPTTDASIVSLDYAFMGIDTSLRVYESGAEIATIGTFAPTDILSIEYRGNRVTYRQNGTIVWVTQTTEGRTFYFDSSFLHVSPRGGLTNIAFGSVGDVGTLSWTPVVSTGMVRSGSTFTKTGTSGSWDAGFSSLEKAAQVAVSFKASQTNKRVMVGLNSDPATDNNYTSIDYALHPAQDGNLYVYNNGNPLNGGSSVTSYTSVDVLGVAHRDNAIVALKNGAVIFTYTTAASPAALFAVDSSFVEAGAEVNSVSVTVGGSNGLWTDMRFMRSASAPAAPTGDDPSGWDNAIPSGSDPLWSISATKRLDGSIIGAWSTPAIIGGQLQPTPYAAGTTYYQYQTVTFSGGTYMLTVASSVGNAPSGTAQGNAFWDVIAAPGAAGAPATPPSSFTSTINLTSGGGVNLRTIADAAGYTGQSDATITFNVGATTVIRAVGGNNSHAVNTGTWPTGTGLTIALTLAIASGGIVEGGGGRGGDGGGWGGGPSSGGNGGAGIYMQNNLTVTNAGRIAGGGGGGGGGKKTSSGAPEFIIDPGSGGGGGAPNGPGGIGGDGDMGPAGDGTSGTTSGGGSGAASGGNYGVAGGTPSGGALGGAAGNSIKRNGYTLTYSGAGTKVGTDA